MLGLNRQERQVVLFLIVMSLIGIGVNLLLKALPLGDRIQLNLQDIAKIDLNHADKNLLMAVPGIKEKLAQAIIERREEKGVFSDIEELKQIKGITSSKYEKIKDSFCLR